MARLLIVLVLGGAATLAQGRDVSATCPIRPGTLCVEADLQGAQLPGATLVAADLSGADLRGASLEGADTRGCVGCQG
jgi:uncharacterized protein YjbI with pentapeptide repeats